MSSITLQHLQDVLFAVRDRFGRASAVELIRKHGEAERLAEVPPANYEVLHAAASSFLALPIHVGNLSRAASVLVRQKEALDKALEVLMTAKDDLSAAVDGAVSEMSKAADFIRNHPAAADDPDLKAMADRLTAASQALAGVDTGSTTSGTDTVTGGNPSDTVTGGTPAA